MGIVFKPTVVSLGLTGAFFLLCSSLLAEEHATWQIAAHSVTNENNSNTFGVCCDALLLGGESLRPIAWFTLNKRPNEKGRYGYLLFFKTPGNLGGGSINRSGRWQVSADHADCHTEAMLLKKRIETAYKFEADRKTHELIREKVKVGGQELKAGSPRVFLVDLTKDQISYQPLKVELPDEVPDLADGDHKTWAPLIGRTIDHLKKTSPAAKDFFKSSTSD